MATAYCQNDFYPRPPRGGRRQQPYKISCPQGISIHALREEGDQAAAPEAIQPKEFLSTPSARRATERASRPRCGCPNFYPRPPRGGRPEDGWVEEAVLTISIHALREEGDSSCRTIRTAATYFYPRPPRGGRLASRICSSTATVFLSTPSARRATVLPDGWEVDDPYFYPRPPRGGRLRHSSKLQQNKGYFYPRPPRGGRPGGA